jgi:hypothetical protein
MRKEDESIQTERVTHRIMGVSPMKSSGVLMILGIARVTPDVGPVEYCIHVEWCFSAGRGGEEERGHERSVRRD